MILGVAPAVAKDVLVAQADWAGGHDAKLTVRQPHFDITHVSQVKALNVNPQLLQNAQALRAP